MKLRLEMDQDPRLIIFPCSHVATLEHELSNQKLEVWSDQPGLELYTGNFLPSGTDKDGPLKGIFNSSITNNTSDNEWWCFRKRWKLLHKMGWGLSDDTELSRRRQPSKLSTSNPRARGDVHSQCVLQIFVIYIL